MQRGWIALLLVGTIASAVRAGDEAPAPRLIAPLPQGPIGFYRQSNYEVWQNLAVDGRGFFRPRVIYTPYGAFYRYNGEAYSGVTTRQINFMPYASD